MGLGANLGDRLANLQGAVARLDRIAGLHVLRSSRVYETRPVGPPQGDFLNAVIEVESTLDAADLLAASLRVEGEMGRVRRERWGPRTIDIDVLTYGRTSITSPGLVIPHPRMHERIFVLAPLLELETDPMLPGGRRVASLQLRDDVTGVRPYAPPLVDN